MPAWLLPESISDILPAEARRIEELRRGLLDLFRTYGYELVMPPLLEYTESLLSGTGQDMDLQMFKLVDQISGRTMGLRADITPQVARIDAHLLNRQGVTRLCYAGSVVHTRPQALSATREPLQVGAEIYGHAGLEADLEIQQLLLAALERVGIPEVRLDLGHAQILRAILATDPAGFVVAEQVHALLSAKDRDGLAQLQGLLPETTRAVVALCELYGGVEVIDRARHTLPPLPRIGAALDALATLVAGLDVTQVTIDLADIRGYYYHSGVMFSAYCEGLPSAVARGGRYDQVGEAFGRARPAAGFSLYLRDLAPLLPHSPVPGAIWAPFSNDVALRSRISALRSAGEIVVQALPGHESELEEFHCDRMLVLRAEGWTIEPFHAEHR
ncbi:MAG: ATP phosphoribosyltransferase regulatory subunit [Burkholderiaceae bacterium]|jgi:ATP phosphoribosyltransferase regulatory subunit